MRNLRQLWGQPPQSQPIPALLDGQECSPQRPGCLPAWNGPDHLVVDLSPGAMEQDAIPLALFTPPLDRSMEALGTPANGQVVLRVQANVSKRARPFPDPETTDNADRAHGSQFPDDGSGDVLGTPPLPNAEPAPSLIHGIDGPAKELGRIGGRANAHNPIIRLCPSPLPHLAPHWLRFPDYPNPSTCSVLEC